MKTEELVCERKGTSGSEQGNREDDLMLWATDNYMCVRRCYNKFVILYGNLKTQICKYYTVDLFILCVGGKAKKCLGTQVSTGEVGKVKLADASEERGV